MLRKFNIILSVGCLALASCGSDEKSEEKATPLTQEQKVAIKESGKKAATFLSGALQTALKPSVVADLVSPQPKPGQAPGAAQQNFDFRPLLELAEKEKMKPGSVFNKACTISVGEEILVNGKTLRKALLDVPEMDSRFIEKKVPFIPNSFTITGNQCPVELRVRVPEITYSGDLHEKFAGKVTGDVSLVAKDAALSKELGIQSLQSKFEITFNADSKAENAKVFANSQHTFKPFVAQGEQPTDDIVLETKGDATVSGEGIEFSVTFSLSTPGNPTAVLRVTGDDESEPKMELNGEPLNEEGLLNLVGLH